jgi:hypothetical protein
MSAPRVVTVADLVADVAERFRKAYQRHDGTWSEPRFASPERLAEIHAALLAARTRADVEAVLPGKGWVDIECDNCEASVDLVVELRSGNDAEYGPSRYCAPCLRAAAALVPEVEP